jgi:hypothetical protein
MGNHRNAVGEIILRTTKTRNRLILALSNRQLNTQRRHAGHDPASTALSGQRYGSPRICDIPPSDKHVVITEIKTHFQNVMHITYNTDSMD